MRVRIFSGKHGFWAKYLDVTLTRCRVVEMHGLLVSREFSSEHWFYGGLMLLNRHQSVMRG